MRLAAHVVRIGDKHCSEHLKRRDHLEDLDVESMIIFKLMLQVKSGMVCTVFI
jgi:hypothetical protein